MLVRILALALLASAIAANGVQAQATHRVRVQGHGGVSLHHVRRDDAVRLAIGTTGPANPRYAVAITEPTYELACIAPCELELRTGTYAFGVGSPGGDTHRWPDVVRIDDDVDILISYDDRDVWRVTGWTIAILGIALGIVPLPLAASGLGGLTLSITAATSFILGLCVGLPLATISDGIDLRVGRAGLLF